MKIDELINSLSYFRTIKTDMVSLLSILEKVGIIQSWYYYGRGMDDCFFIVFGNRSYKISRDRLYNGH